MKKVEVTLNRSGQRITILTESPAGELVDLTLMQEAIVQLYHDKERLLNVIRNLKILNDKMLNNLGVPGIANSITHLTNQMIDETLKKEA